MQTRNKVHHISASRHQIISFFQLYLATLNSLVNLQVGFLKPLPSLILLLSIPMHSVSSKNADACLNCHMTHIVTYDSHSHSVIVFITRLQGIIFLLQNEYIESKNVKNVFQRYNQLKAMVKVKYLTSTMF